MLNSSDYAKNYASTIGKSLIDGSGKRKRQLAIELRCKNPWKLYSKLIE